MFSICLSSCGDECNEKSAPVYLVYFKKQYPFNQIIDTSFYKVYASGYSKEISKEFNTYRLPLSLHSDTILYVFDSGTNKDTLELRYTKKMEYESNDCGFTASFSNVKSGNRTSFYDVKIDDQEIYITF